MTIEWNDQAKIYAGLALFPIATGVSSALLGTAFNTRTFLKGFALASLPMTIPTWALCDFGMKQAILDPEDQKPRENGQMLRNSMSAAIGFGGAWLAINGPLYAISQLYSSKISPYVASLNGALAGSLTLGGIGAAVNLGLKKDESSESDL